MDQQKKLNRFGYTRCLAAYLGIIGIFFCNERVYAYHDLSGASYSGILTGTSTSTGRSVRFVPTY